MITDNENKKDW